MIPPTRKNYQVSAERGRVASNTRNDQRIL
jgi:hypothetical protein